MVPMNDKLTPSLMKIKRDVQHRVKICVMASNGIRGVVIYQIFFINVIHLIIIVHTQSCLVCT